MPRCNCDPWVSRRSTTSSRRRSDGGTGPTRSLGRTSGPAGNAQLTAWTGLLLLALAVVELVTLIDVRGLLSWHVVVGVLLAAVAVLKIASTGWRFLRYYSRNRPYQQAGPPPMLLRILGPLVVLGTVAVLTTGIWLIAVGPDSGRTSLVTVLGQRIDLLSIHQASFIVFAVAAGLHLLARLVPAVVLATERDPPGGGPAPRARSADRRPRAGTRRRQPWRPR